MKYYITILFILIISLFLRFWQLSAYPISLTVDEVAIGYGSNSLFHTGRDERGQFMPLAFYSLGDYKPPLNFYLEVPFTGFLGTSELSARFPVALLGSFTSVVFIILLRKLGLSKASTLFGGLWFSVLPWHVHYSRFGTEAVAGLFLTILGLALWISAFKKRSFINFTFGLIALLLTVWTYHSQRLFTPLLCLFIIIQYRHQLKQILNTSKRRLVITVITCLFILPLILLAITSPAIVTRAAQTSIIRDPALSLSLHNGIYPSLLSRIFDSDMYLIWHQWNSRYLSYMDIRFWFHKAMNFTLPGYPDLGLVYLLDFPLFIIGVFCLFTKKFSRISQLAIFWFLVGPLPASLTMHDQHTLRSLIWSPAFGLIIVIGFQYIWTKVRSKLLISSLYLLILCVSIIYFWDLYTIQFPRYYAPEWHYGFKQAAIYACENKYLYDRIVISPTFGDAGPTLTGLPEYYTLFFCHIPPRQHLSSSVLPGFDFSRVDWEAEKKLGLNSLLISARWDYPLTIPPEDYVIKRIDYPSLLPDLYFVRTKNE